MSQGTRDEDRPSKLETFSGSTQEYKRWRRKAELHLLGLPSNVGKTKWGPRLLDALSGEPWDLLESLSIKDITAEEGYKTIFSTLDAKYAERAEDELQRALREYFYTVNIRAGEEFRAFIVRLETSYRLLKSHEVELPEEVRGWFLLKKLHLDQTQEARVLTSTSGKLGYKEVVNAVRSVFPHGKGQPGKNRDNKDVFEVNQDDEWGEPEEDRDDHEREEVFEVWQGIADQVQQQEDYDSDEALEVFESYRDIKRRVQEKKMGRGYKPVPQQWNLTGSIKAKVEALKSKTRCFICQKQGHWKKECPERRGRKETGAFKGQKKEASDVNFCEVSFPDTFDAYMMEPVDQDDAGHKNDVKSKVGEPSFDVPFNKYVTKIHKKFRRALFLPGHAEKSCGQGVLSGPCAVHGW